MKLIRTLLMTLALVVCVNTAVLNWQMLRVDQRMAWMNFRSDIHEMVLATTPAPASVILKEALQSTVVIEVNTNEIDILTGEKLSGIGAGVVVDSSGVILTCKHMVENLDPNNPSSITLLDGTKLTIVKVAVDPNLDIALCKVNPNTSLRAISISEVQTLQVGDTVYVIGTPSGLRFSVSQGVVSRIYEPDEDGSSIQTDAAINPGNSGGPVIDDQGRLVGIAQGIISPGHFSVGLGLAVGVDQISAVLPKLLEELNK